VIRGSVNIWAVCGDEQARSYKTVAATSLVDQISIYKVVAPVPRLWILLELQSQLEGRLVYDSDVYLLTAGGAKLRFLVGDGNHRVRGYREKDDGARHPVMLSCYVSKTLGLKERVATAHRVNRVAQTCVKSGFMDLFDHVSKLLDFASDGRVGLQRKPKNIITEELADNFKVAGGKDGANFVNAVLHLAGVSEGKNHVFTDFPNAFNSLHGGPAVVQALASLLGEQKALVKGELLKISYITVRSLRCPTFFSNPLSLTLA
jgi:hypothetical protein